MNVTLNKGEMAVIEQKAIEKATQKAAKSNKMTVEKFLTLYKCTSISYYNGLFTVEFSSRIAESMKIGKPVEMVIRKPFMIDIGR